MNNIELIRNDPRLIDRANADAFGWRQALALYLTQMGNVDYRETDLPLPRFVDEPDTQMGLTVDQPFVLEAFDRLNTGNKLAQASVVKMHPDLIGVEADRIQQRSGAGEMDLDKVAGLVMLEGMLVMFPDMKPKAVFREVQAILANI